MQQTNPVFVSFIFSCLFFAFIRHIIEVHLTTFPLPSNRIRQSHRKFPKLVESLQKLQYLYASVQSNDTCVCTSLCSQMTPVFVRLSAVRWHLCLYVFLQSDDTCVCTSLCSQMTPVFVFFVAVKWHLSYVGLTATSERLYFRPIFNQKT